ncbi:predicted protein [Chaetoceros tenuissimus]|uniref:Uncharacterized protein n=1 Tax=Chaetoceros tenuissimus TaxID=426638 RepID=A0AAD3H2T0_9STRA|nr:predicted protein [Chaetoceros tenuissimus]
MESRDDIPNFWMGGGANELVLKKHGLDKYLTSGSERRDDNDEEEMFNYYNGMESHRSRSRSRARREMIRERQQKECYRQFVQSKKPQENIVSILKTSKCYSRHPTKSNRVTVSSETPTTIDIDIEMLDSDQGIAVSHLPNGEVETMFKGLCIDNCSPELDSSIDEDNIITKTEEIQTFHFPPEKCMKRDIALRLHYAGVRFKDITKSENEEAVKQSLFAALKRTKLLAPNDHCAYDCFQKAGMDELTSVGKVATITVRSAFPIGTCLEYDFFNGSTNLDVERMPSDSEKTFQSFVPKGLMHYEEMNSNFYDSQDLVKAELQEKDFVQILNDELPPSIRVLCWSPANNAKDSDNLDYLKHHAIRNFSSIQHYVEDEENETRQFLKAGTRTSKKRLSSRNQSMWSSRAE